MEDAAVYSYTKLKTFQDCPARWYRIYGLGRKEPPREPAELGRAVHRAVQLVLADGLILEAAVLRGLTEAALKLPAREVADMARRVLEFARPGAKAELYFCLPLDPEDAGAVWLEGYIDYLDEGAGGRPLVVDWKTTRYPTAHDATHQLGLYAWAAAQLTGAEEVSAMLVFPRFSRDRDSGGVYGPAEMRAALDWALDLANAVEERLVALAAGGDPDELFPPEPGAACRWCGFALECRGEAEAAEPVADPIATPEEAETVAAELMRLEAAASPLKARLKEWVAAHGPVTVGDRQWALVPDTRWNFTPEALAAVAGKMVDEGINPWEIFTLGAGEVKRLKKYGWDEAVLEALGGRPTVSHSLRTVKVEQGKAKGKGRRSAA